MSQFQPHLHFRRATGATASRLPHGAGVDAADDLTAARVCAGEIRHKPPVASRPFSVFAIYCLDDLALSQTTAWTNATSPDDPRVEAPFVQLFLVLFDHQPRPRFPYRPFSRW